VGGLSPFPVTCVIAIEKYPVFKVSHLLDKC